MKIKTNPDKEFAEQIRKALKENNGFCSCSLIKNEDTICMCKEFRDMIERGETGSCHCGLWIAEKETDD